LLTEQTEQGEEHLTAATLSPDGELLMTATVTQVKMFALDQANEDEGGVLRVHKLDIPQTLSDAGAKALALSPDGQWLCLVRPNNDIYMAKIAKPDNPEYYPRILPTLAKLRLVPRREQKERQKLFHGSLGAYERTIHSIAFSSDSRILACGDVSGAIDTWVLKESKPSAAISAKPKTNGHAAAESSDEDEDSDSDSVLGGQSWEHPMGESALPRLKAGILLLSFRPLPKDDRLVVMTTTHELLEFSVLSGGLSEWSRRNTKEFMPQGFNGIKHRAMGALWDVSNGSDRLWLYGPSWLWMFDLSQDFSTDEGAKKQLAEKAKQSNKRKRKADEDRQRLKKINTGAGDRMPASLSGIALGDRMRKVVGKSINQGELIQINRRPQQMYTVDDDDDEDISTANNRTLAQFRREREVIDSTNDVIDLTAEEDDDKQVTQNGLESALDPDQPFAVVIDNRPTKDIQKQFADNQLQQVSKPETDAERDRTPEQQEQEHNNRRWWHTFKYREVLGIVPLSADPESRLEVAVVERPLFDLTLTGRYVRDYEQN
jgi:U3 small nucleolar RNA-associated protein 4